MSEGTVLAFTFSLSCNSPLWIIDMLPRGKKLLTKVCDRTYWIRFAEGKDYEEESVNFGLRTVLWNQETFCYKQTKLIKMSQVICVSHCRLYSL